jgi:tryptophanase
MVCEYAERRQINYEDEQCCNHEKDGFVGSGGFCGCNDRVCMDLRCQLVKLFLFTKIDQGFARFAEIFPIEFCQVQKEEMGLWLA